MLPSSLSSSASAVTVLIFGPQFLSFGDEHKHLRLTLVAPPSRQWVLETASQLSNHWATIIKDYPLLENIPVVDLLSDLVCWLETGTFFPKLASLPNALLTPLVVMTQLSQYLQYIDLVSPGTQDPHSVFSPNLEAVGFCVGLLSASAVASSTNYTSFYENATKAVRLAMLIGGFVDAYNSNASGRDNAKSFSVGWNSPEIGSKVALIVNNFPEAYTSVLYDEKRITITVSENCTTSLLHRLKEVGATASELTLRGRFHCADYKEDVERLVRFCDCTPGFQLANASELVLPLRSNVGGRRITEGRLDHIALHSILVQQADWYQTFVAVQASRLTNPNSRAVSFGLQRCVPSTLSSQLGSRLLHFADVDGATLQSAKTPSKSQTLSRCLGDVIDNDIAVVGMACKVPGADDVEEFWNLLCRGESQHRELSNDRFELNTVFRDTDPKRRWFGNFLDDVDAFDHKFFKKSARESTSMDPQQRLLLQIAYQAVAQSGYFNVPGAQQDQHIGCYIGVSNVDYQDNIACHPATAYSATGTLMSFVAGKIAHYFGWTGPAMSVDTACSGSAVAIHQACKAVLSGECTAALAGGVNVMTGPLWFHNLAGASFLSQTGPCKPFDARGDGYCRGEAVGAVFLKKLSKAIQDGDQVLGVIAGTAVFQNQNCTAITVPNSTSLRDLFYRVTSQARIDPMDVSVVEAHGTGTAVGDPAEYNSIREVFGGPNRKDILSLGSVKGLVGHAECASGMVSLIKMLLMVQRGVIPPQASFHTINPNLNASPADNIEIRKSLTSWNADFRVALVNNYGASGSNAAMVISQAPIQHKVTMGTAKNCKQPFWLSGYDDQNLRANAKSLLKFVKEVKNSSQVPSMSDLSFNLYRQSNSSLSSATLFGCDSIGKLEDMLTAITNEDPSVTPLYCLESRPVVLCFGGQVSTFVGLDRHLYDNITLLRNHLDHCNHLCLTLGLDGIYPEIFQRTPIEDTVKLQTVLFAMQYSCAKTWIDCGVKVASVVGHSFGELTALCVADGVTVADAIKMVAARARVIRDSWGLERGAMAAVEGNLQDVENLLLDSSKVCNSERAATIACYNGPRSFTLAGSSKAIDAVVGVVRENNRFSSTMKVKKLNVTNAFHSTLVDPLMAELEQSASSINFQVPTIPIERATEVESSRSVLTPRFIAEHLRNPVYFDHALRRLSARYPACMFLEAGSNSTITTMAARALGPSSGHHFQAINITSNNAWQNLTDATLTMWKQGLRVAFWPHHASQTYDYTTLLLPPFQFQKSRHWLDLKQPDKTLFESAVSSTSEQEPKGLWTFVGYQDVQQRHARFRINSMTKEFEIYVSGHTVAHSAPLCPSTLQLDIAIESILSLRPEFLEQDMQPQLAGMENHAPLCIDASRKVWLDVEATDAEAHHWEWKIFSNGESGSTSTTHVSGQIIFKLGKDIHLQKEFKRYERLVGHRRCLALLESKDVDGGLEGRNIYQTFAEVVDYGEIFRGVKKVVGKNNESAGRVVMPYTGKTWLDTPLCDSFCQVAGIYINCMTDHSDKEVCISSGVNQLIRSPLLRPGDSRPDSWDVFAVHHQSSPRSWSSDVFIFDPRTGNLSEIILGIEYQLVSKVAMGNMLLRLTPGYKPRPTNGPVAPAAESSGVMKTQKVTQQSQKGSIHPKTDEGHLGQDIKNLVANVTGVEVEKIQKSTMLADIGIDSLMGMELAREIEIAFKCELDTNQLMLLTDFDSLTNCVHSALGINNNAAPSDGAQSPTESSLHEVVTPGTCTPSYAADSDITSPFSEAYVDIQPEHDTSDYAVQQAQVDAYVRKYSEGFSSPIRLDNVSPDLSSNFVLVTGATGSLGSHLVAHLAQLPNVDTVMCLNRASAMDATLRQKQAMESRGIRLDQTALQKVQVLEVDTSKPRLGLAANEYDRIVRETTHIIHNAWPMTITRPVNGFESQFQAMRNLLDLARDVAAMRPQGPKVGFQFISSIATVGLYPCWTGKTIVPESPMTIRSVLPSGYGQAKLVCEKLVEKTLQQYPDCFRPMIARVGQIAGSRQSGYWNPAEHLSFLIKSSETLQALPDFMGDLSWLPVNDVAATLSDLLLSDVGPSPIYHIENPARQSWSEIISLFAELLNIPRTSIIPFKEWVEKVQEYPASGNPENPAKKILEFFDDHFMRMACGGLVLDTTMSRAHSQTLANAKPISVDLVQKYVEYWKKTGFLHG
ncbi:hypothetical protein BGW36DRAFT_421463 [Talaromyces proteolyticus]|uniref:Polyketide synthase n=1 Tax=Talaromyces proteolyticus TaxID=1131652 RepID=A0AAD4Q5R0_9EURO|nr:uncharacterized protein BGW36DRAFT_421463 [Talaromyces proteolyticus]KAH8704876.1 hypothetical protein BGW36DRAFT_421463 [Talaromyces proteolyticus]